MSEQQGQGTVEFQDRVLTCVDCKQEFTWSAGEQEYFREKGFTDKPKRCQSCRQAKRQRYGDADMNRGGKK